MSFAAPYCTICDTHFHNSTLKKKHVKNVHPGLNPPKIMMTREEFQVKYGNIPVVRDRTCPACFQMFSCKTACMKHVLRKHVNNAATSVNERNSVEPTHQTTKVRDIPLPPLESVNEPSKKETLSKDGAPTPDQKGSGTPKQDCITCLMYLYY